MQIALLVHRVGTGVEAMPPQKVLQLATTGGASILGQPEIGQIKAGSAADLAMFRLDRIDFAGAMTDPASAPLFCGAAPRAEYTVVAGRVLVEKGQLVGVDEEALFERANRVAERMLSTAERKLGTRYR
jgi:cytosine/adenosine deaminase-related metal-dependent hydrolase